MANFTLRTATCLIGIVLAPSLVSQPGTSSRQTRNAASQPGTASKPRQLQKEQEDRVRKQARRLVTFLELDDRRADAADALLKMGAKAAPALLRALDDPRPVVVQRVCHILRLGSQLAGAKERLLVLSRSKDPQLACAARYALAGIQPAGITLTTEYLAHKVIEVDRAGKVVRTLTGVKGPWDAELLSNGNYLICSVSASKVVEMTAKGRVVWSYAKVKSPHKAQRLPNGNTLITDMGSGHRVLEVDRAGKTVWEYGKGGIMAYDVERLVNGNTLIADARAKRVIEVTPEGKIAWQHKHGQEVYDVDRLPDGNTLIATYRPGKVIEVTPAGKVVWELEGPKRPHDADRLPNGHTLVAQPKEVAEYDRKGKKVWSTKVKYPGEANRY